MKKFVTHATCHDSLGLQEHETYLIMGQTSDLWRVKSECVGGSCCPGDSGLGPLPYPSPVLGVKVSTTPVNTSLGFQGCPEWRCRLCTAQLQGTPFIRRCCKCSCKFPTEGRNETEEGEHFLIPSSMG